VDRQQVTLMLQAATPLLPIYAKVLIDSLESGAFNTNSMVNRTSLGIQRMWKPTHAAVLYEKIGIGIGI
jgi:hypothetical protein